MMQSLLCICINTRYLVHSQCFYHAKMLRNVRIVEFHYCIWNHHAKCIQISTNMPGIGLVNCKIAYEIWQTYVETHAAIPDPPFRAAYVSGISWPWVDGRLRRVAIA